MNTKRLILVLAGCLVLGAVAVQAQQPPRQEGQRPGPGGAPPPDGRSSGMMMPMDEKCAMMQRMMDEMSVKMHDAHEKLNRMMHEMNTTTGPAKVEAMAATVNEMAAQAEMMHRMHGEMMQSMMAHLVEHMAQGAGPKAQEGMQMCPMMQGPGAPGGPDAPGGQGPKGEPPAPQKPEGGADDHSAHHPPAE